MVVHAQEEARRLNHCYIGTEHIVLGILHEGDGVAARILSEAGAEPDRVRVMMVDALDAAPRPRVARPPRLGRRGASAAWLGRVHPGLDRLDQEIRDELGREADDGDLCWRWRRYPGSYRAVRWPSSGSTAARCGGCSSAYGASELRRRPGSNANARRCARPRRRRLRPGTSPRPRDCAIRSGSSRSVNEVESRR